MSSQFLPTTYPENASQTQPNGSVFRHLFVEPKNQEILWKLIHTSPLFISKRNVYSEEEFKLLFKQTVGYFYDARPVVADYETLQKTNKEFLIRFLHVLGEASNASVKKDNQVDGPPIESPPIESPYGKVRQNEFASAFQHRQQEFDAFHKKPASTESNPFLEPVIDEPISNMEELIEKHKKEREQFEAHTE
jgi:hypothetical protein